MMLRRLRSVFQGQHKGESLIQIASPDSNAALTVSWIIPHKLALGRLPVAGESGILRQLGIQTVLSLCAIAEGELPEEIVNEFHCFRFILPDSSYVLSLQPEHLLQAIALIHEHIQQQSPVYVHCLAGIERSPTVCIAYLCMYEQLELWEALNHVKQAHPIALPSETQLQVIRKLMQRSPLSPDCP